MAKSTSKLPPPWHTLTVGKDKRGKPRHVIVNLSQIAYMRALSGGGTKIYFVSGNESLVVEEAPDEIIS